MSISLRDNQVKMGSEKQFGLVFALFFAVLACFPLVNGGMVNIYLFGVAVTLCLISLVCPRIFKPFNVVWFKFGLFLHKIVSPIALGTIFFIVLTPVAALKKVFGSSSLDLRFDPSAKTYWKKKKPTQSSLRNQF